MNYAKEAYYKVETLAALASAPKASSDVFSDIGAGGDLARVDKNTLVSVTAELTGSGSAHVLLDGSEVAAFNVPGTSTVVFAAAEAGMVSVSATGATFGRVILSSLGGSEPVRAYLPAQLRADEYGSEVLAAVVGDVTTIYLLLGSAFIPLCSMGSCDDADICARGRVTVYCSGGHAYAVKQGAQSGSVYLGAGRHVAVCHDGAGYIAATDDGTKVTVIQLTDELIPVRSYSCHGSPTVDALAFAKGAEPAQLIVSDSGRNLVRRVSHGGDGAISGIYAVTEG